MSAINKALSKRPLILRLTRFLLKRSHGNQEAVQEAIQETYLAVSRSYATFSHKSTFFTWVCKIALNKLRDYYRDQVRHESHFIVPAIDTLNSIFDPGVSPEEKVTLDELRSRVNACLNLLPPQYRQLLQLRYYEDLSNRQISLKLNISKRSLEGKLYRAKKLLAKLYAPEK